MQAQMRGHGSWVVRNDDEEDADPSPAWKIEGNLASSQNRSPLFQEKNEKFMYEKMTLNSWCCSREKQRKRTSYLESCCVG